MANILATASPHIKAKVIENAWNFFVDYLLDESKPAITKAEILKDLLHLKPHIKELRLIIKTDGKETNQVFNLKYNRNEYPELYIWRKEVLKRDNYTCILCGAKGNTYLNCHHIINRHKCKNIFDINNLVTLCRECHLHMTNIEMTERYIEYKEKFNLYIQKLLKRR